MRNNIKQLSILLAVLFLLSTILSPLVNSEAKLGILSSHKKAKERSLFREVKEKFTDLIRRIVERIVERFPKLANLPLIQKILNMDTRGNKGYDREIEKERKTDYGKNVRDIKGASGTDESQKEIDVKALCQQTEERIKNDTKKRQNPFIKASSGIIIITGNATVDLSGEIIRVANETITLSGRVNLYSRDNRLKIEWDIERAYLKISGQGSFTLENFYVDIDGKLILGIGYLHADGNGYILIDGREGIIIVDGASKLDGLDLNLDLNGKKLTLKASLSLQARSKREGIRITWGEKTFSITGISGKHFHFSLENLVFIYDRIKLLASMIEFEMSLNSSFIEQDNGTIICRIRSFEFDAKNIYLSFDNRTVSLEKLKGSGTITLYLEEERRNYVTSEGDHLVISGNFVMDIDSSIEVNGREVKVKGCIAVGREDGKVEIWWNESRKYLVIDAPYLTMLFDFTLSVDSTNILLATSECTLKGLLYVDGEKRQFKVEGYLDFCDLELKIGKFYMEVGHLHQGIQLGNTPDLPFIGLYPGVKPGINISWSNESVVACLNGGLSVDDFYFQVGNTTVSITSFSVSGHIYGEFTKEHVYIEGIGNLRIEGIYYCSGKGESAKVLVLEYIELFGGSGSVKFLLNKGIMKIDLYSITASLFIGGIDISAGGYLSVTIDLVNHTVYGKFGAGAYIRMEGMEIGVKAGGTFVIKDKKAIVRAGGTFGPFVLSFPITYKIDNLTILAGVDIVASGAFGLVAYIDLVTMRIYMRGIGVGVAVASVSSIKVEGTNVNIDEEEIEELLGIDIPEDTTVGLHIGSINLDGNGYIQVVAGFVATIPGFSLDYSISELGGDLKPTYNAEDVEFFVEKNGTRLSLFADSIEGNCSVTFNTNLRSKLEASIKAPDLLKVKGFGFSLNGPEGGYVKMVTDETDIGFSLDIYWKKGESLTLSSEGDLTITGFSTSSLIPGFPDENSSYLSSTTVETIMIEGSCDCNISFYENGSIRAASGNLTLNGEIKGIHRSWYIRNETTGEKETGADLTIEEIYGSVEVNVDYDGEITVIGLSGGVSVHNISLENLKGSNKITIGKVEMDGEGKVKIDKNGTIGVEGEINVRVRDVSVNITRPLEQLGLVNESTEYTMDINLAGNGTFVWHPGNETTPPWADVNGTAKWKGEGKGFKTEGDVEVHGKIRIKYRNITDILTGKNITTMVDIICEGKATANISLELATNWGNCTFYLKNFSGEGMFEFYINLSERKLYLNNQLNATWDVCELTFIDNLIVCEIYRFQGDIGIENFTFNKTLQEQLKKNKGVDPDNWTFHSKKGYETLLGFNFSSKGGFVAGLDVNFPIFSFQFDEVHLDEGTEGRIQIDVDERGNLLISLIATKGYANINMTVFLSIGGGDIIGLKFSLDSEQEKLHLAVGDLVRIIDFFKDKEFTMEEFCKDFDINRSDLRKMLDYIKNRSFDEAWNYFLNETAIGRILQSLQDVYISYQGIECPICLFLMDLIEEALQRDDLPDWLRVILQFLLNKLREMTTKPPVAPQELSDYISPTNSSDYFSDVIDAVQDLENNLNNTDSSSTQNELTENTSSSEASSEEESEASQPNIFE